MPEAELEPIATGRPATILIVDDLPDVRRMLRRVLGTKGHYVLEASSAREAIAIVRIETVDFVVSDVQMPDLNGVELLRALHEIDADLPVLLLSGAPDLTTALKAVEYGALEYLTKPVGVEKLLESVTRGLEASRKRQEERRALKELRSGERARPIPSSRAGSDVAEGTLLGGRYRVGPVLGRGGMGTVYEGVREDLSLRVAIKVLHEPADAGSAYLARFRREAETVAAINHPNIVRILDFQANEDEPPFLVMELLEGDSLARTIALEGKLTQERTAFIASQVLAALTAAHAANVVHRDLKPENVFLTSASVVRDIVRVLDFGVAKIMSATPDARLTQTGTVLGTPAYMPPEQARGVPVDTRSDLYTVGCILYECVTGIPPFQAENYNALLFAIQQGLPGSLRKLLPELDPEFSDVIEKAMANDPAARFQTAEEMSRALSRFLSTSPSGPPSAPRSSPMAFAPTQGDRERPR